LPCRFEVGVGVIERRGSSVLTLARIQGGIKAADPRPLIDVGRATDTARDRADMDVAIEDMPAILAFGISAAGEGRHRYQLSAGGSGLRMPVCSTTRVTAERNELELRLKQLALGVETQHAKSSTGRRPYPKVVPKFRNPDRPSETWTGRGRTPRWLAAQIKRGKRIDDFRIERAAA
jgi:DNA-binding protein H-NS